MTHILVQEIEKKQREIHSNYEKVPALRPGYLVRVHQKIKEGEKERVQIFEGLVISINSGHGASKTFMVRKEVEGIGVEKIFPVASPNVVKVEIIRTHKVRRAKLFYMRGLSGKSARLREKLGMIEKDAKYYEYEVAKKKGKKHLKGENDKKIENAGEVVSENVEQSAFESGSGQANLF